MIWRVVWGLGMGLWLAACAPAAPVTPENTPVEPEATAVTPPPSPSAPATADVSRYADYEMVTLLPRDAIPAIDAATFLTAVAADQFYDADELVIGVDIEGEARAYSVPLLSNHEIVNDMVGGRKIAVTW